MQTTRRAHVVNSEFFPEDAQQFPASRLRFAARVNVCFRFALEGNIFLYRASVKIALRRCDARVCLQLRGPHPVRSGTGHRSPLRFVSPAFPSGFRAPGRDRSGFRAIDVVPRNRGVLETHDGRRRRR